MYESGVLFALIIWAISICIFFVKINSWTESNLRKVGMRHSWLTLRPKPLTREAQNRGLLKNAGKFVLINSIGLVGILFSWGYVIFYLVSFAYSQFADIGAPAAVKEFRWKMRNMNLTTDEVLQGMASVSGSQVPLDELRKDLYADLEERGLMILK